MVDRRLMVASGPMPSVLMWCGIDAVLLMEMWLPLAVQSVVFSGILPRPLAATGRKGVSIRGGAFVGEGVLREYLFLEFRRWWLVGKVFFFIWWVGLCRKTRIA